MKNKTAMVSTLFPSSGGVATYTKYLFDELKNLDEEMLIIADRINEIVKEESNIIRCWDHKPKYFFQIFPYIIKNKVKKVHIQQELHLFGNKITAFLLPFNIFLLRIFGKEVIITLHGVVPLKEVNKDFLKENGYSGKPFFMKFALNILYSSLCFFSSKVIVHEEKFKEYLKDYFVNTNKVYVVGHGIKEIKTLIPKEEAKKKIKLINNKYTFLYFGYVTGYKGIELIIEALKGIKDKDFNFIIVGSEHPRLKEEESYKIYYNDIKSFFKKDKRCRFFGYVPEDEVNYYFRASDCAVFPYTVQMSSSGPMALAIANEVLVLGSDAFKGVLPDELIFQRNKESLIVLMKMAKKSKLNSYKKAIKQMKVNLSWHNIAKKTVEVWKR